jgi:uncharacterized protein (DUF697 family)
MSKRKLPRAIVAQEHPFAFECAASEREGSDEAGITATEAVQNHSNVIDILSKKEPAWGSTQVNASSTLAMPIAGSDATARRASALAIVHRYATFSALGGCIPLPFANFASVTALLVHMVKALSRHYGVPFERDRARAIVVGLVGGAMPSGLASVASSTLVYIVPASAVIGLAVSSMAAAACTRAIGRIFVDHFESGATLQDIEEA